MRLIVALLLTSSVPLQAQVDTPVDCGADSSFVGPARQFTSNLFEFNRGFRDSAQVISGADSTLSLNLVHSSELCNQLRTLIRQELATSPLAGSDLELLGFAAFCLGTGYLAVVNTKAATSVLVIDREFHQRTFTFLVRLSPG